MLGSTLYLVGREKASGAYVAEANPCSMCKRMIINAGIANVIVRDTGEDFRNIVVLDEWIAHDDTLESSFGY
jgi:dCMP deaminase